MRALLRFQAVVVVRAMCNRGLLAIVGLPMLATVLILMVAKGDWDWAGCATLAFAIVLPTVALGMGMTFDAMDAIRWSAPVPRSRVLAAHFLFWTAVSAPLIACAAATRVGESPGATVVFADAMIVTLAAAATVPVAQNWKRSPTFESAMRLIVLVLTLAGLAVWSVDLARAHRSAYCLAPSIAALCIASVVGTRCYFREERLPATTGATDPRDIAPARRVARTPSASLSAGLHHRGLMLLWAVPALMFAFLVGAPTAIRLIMLVNAVTVLASASLSSCRWLLAGPMDRGRLFRRCVGPALLFAVGAVTIRVCVEEFRPGRTVFFNTFRPNAKSERNPDALVLGEVLATEDARVSTNGPAPVAIPGTDLVERPPEIAFVAARVREQLRRQYGLDVPQERIVAGMTRGWPVHWGPNANYWVNEQQDAVFDAMDRVHDDLADEIVAADRRRIVVEAGGGLLLCMVLLRAELRESRRRRRVDWVTLVLFAAVAAPLLARKSVMAESIQAAWFAALSVVEYVSMPVVLLLVAASALALWKSCERAFRRLDITDFAPMTDAWGKPQGS